VARGRLRAVRGLFFIVLAGVMLGPAIHAVLYKFHLDADADRKGE